MSLPVRDIETCFPTNPAHKGPVPFPFQVPWLGAARGKIIGNYFKVTLKKFSGLHGNIHGFFCQGLAIFFPFPSPLPHRPLHLTRSTSPPSLTFKAWLCPVLHQQQAVPGVYPSRDRSESKSSLCLLSGWQTPQHRASSPGSDPRCLKWGRSATVVFCLEHRRKNLAKSSHCM